MASLALAVIRPRRLLINLEMRYSCTNHSDEPCKWFDNLTQILQGDENNLVRLQHMSPSERETAPLLICPTADTDGQKGVTKRKKTPNSMHSLLLFSSEAQCVPHFMLWCIIQISSWVGSSKETSFSLSSYPWEKWLNWYVSIMLVSLILDHPYDLMRSRGWWANPKRSTYRYRLEDTSVSHERSTSSTLSLRLNFIPPLVHGLHNDWT